MKRPVDDTLENITAALRRRERALALLHSNSAPPDFSNTVDFALPSTANLREHPMAKAKRAKAQRMAGHVMAMKFPKILPGEKWIFILTRCAPKRLDSDNVASCFKGARDGIADRIKVDDGETRILWESEQQKSKTPRLKFEAWRLSQGETP